MSAGAVPALEATSLTKRFDGVVAVDSVSLEVETGEIVGLIGPNGAGKTTLFNLLSGVLRADAGKVAIRGSDVTGVPPHRLARLGLVRTFQLARELDRLSVIENVLLAAPASPGERLVGALFQPGAVRRAEQAAIARAREFLALVSLSSQEALPAAALSGGQKKLLELARCLMAGADIILLDEVGAGVAPHLVDEIEALVLMLNRHHRKTFIIVEHNLGMIRRLSSRVIAMASGRILAEGCYADIAANREVMESYLGQAA